MTFDQLKYFIAVIEHDTFFDAAEDLHITQSALSKQIIKLEKELGVSLLDRSRRTASATEAGMTFYHDCHRLLNLYHISLNHIAPFHSSEKQELRIGTLPILTQYHLTSGFREFQKQFSDIRLLLEETEEPDLDAGLQDNRYDLVIARKNMFSGNGHVLFDLADDTLCAVLPDSLSLCRNLGLHRSVCNRIFSDQCDSLPISALSEIPLILMNRYTSVYQQCIDSFTKEGMHANVKRTARVESIISAVAVGEGASLLPYSNFEIFHHEQIRILALSPNIHLPVVLCCKKDRLKLPAIQQFINFFHLRASYTSKNCNHQKEK